MSKAGRRNDRVHWIRWRSSDFSRSDDGGQIPGDPLIEGQRNEGSGLGKRQLTQLSLSFTFRSMDSDEQLGRGHDGDTSRPFGSVA